MEKICFEYPPYQYLQQVADHCCKAVSTYLALWRTVDRNFKVTIYKKDVREEYLTSLTKFKHDLLLLVKEGLLSIDETPNVLHIELVGWCEEETEEFAC